nr:hypothetical protein NG677_17205 [Methylobacterium sp. OTU13CASTA1]
MKPIKVYEPKFQVRLIKTVDRKTVDGAQQTSERFRGTEGFIDLTPWLGDRSSITTSKSIYEGAGGFHFSMPDKPYSRAGGLDSLYGIVEPMDLVEIRLAHSGEDQPTGKPPLVMRGFVSSVTRDEEMSPNGTPVRTVNIHGQDYGKIWQMIQIFYGPSYILGQDILSSFKLMDRFGAGLKTALTNVDFVKLSVDLINSYLANVLPKDSGFPKITVRAENVIEAAVGITGIQTAEGTIYNLLKSYMDLGPYNELFLTEDDDGVYCVYRQNPALGLSGVPLYPKVTVGPQNTGTLSVDAGQLVVTEIPEKDIVSIKIQRTDAGVANYYWVAAPSFSLNSDVIMRQMGATDANEAKTINLGKYGNCSVDLYGHRMMQVDTHLGGPNVSNVQSGLTERENDLRDNDVFGWIRDRRGFLVAQNKDNSILEKGTLQIRGNEKIRAGNYIKVHRGSVSSLYYVTSVTHRMQPYVGFMTTLNVTRGQGFSDRIKMGGGTDSPYLAERATPGV